MISVELGLEGYAETLAAMNGYVRELRPALRRALRYVARDIIMLRVKENMPVWTGRARASWGVYRRGDLVNRGRTLGRRGALRRIRREEGETASSWLRQYNASSPADAIWVDRSTGEGVPELSITQGTRLLYVELLNSGSSDQAPAGFIDNAILIGREALLKEADREIKAVLSRRSRR